MYDGIVDLSHHDEVHDWHAMRAAGIGFIWHKATQGTGFVDPAYRERIFDMRNIIGNFGSYHFGNASDGAAQAKHLLSNVTTGLPGNPLCLDIEENPPAKGGTMSIHGAEHFVQYVYRQTGRYPWLYANNLFMVKALGGHRNLILANCRYWASDYRASAPVPPVATWPKYDLWQYQEKAVVPGVAGGCDRSRFEGTAEELRGIWK
jgi:lysozyme